MLISILSEIIYNSKFNRGDMQEISVYLNKTASNGQSEFWRKGLDRYLFRSQINWRTPKDRIELKEMIQADILDKVAGIVSIGGDGTVNTIIQNMAGSDVGLLVLPGGTANDLANELGHDRNLKHLVQSIREKNLKKVDLIKINDCFMVTNGGIGFGGDVAMKINNLRKQFPSFRRVMKVSGKRIYSLFVAQELMGLRLKRYPIKITTDDNVLDVDAVTVLINNQKTLAGSFKVAPNTDNTDGKVNVIVLTHKSRKDLISCVLNVALEKMPLDDPHFYTFETSKLSLEMKNGEKVSFFGDGEILGHSEKFEIEVMKQALTLFTKKVNGEKHIIPEELTSLI